MFTKALPLGRMMAICAIITSAAVRVFLEMETSANGPTLHSFITHDGQNKEGFKPAVMRQSITVVLRK